MAVAFCKIRARLSGEDPGEERDYYVTPDSVSLLVDDGKETGLWSSGESFIVVEPIASLIARLQKISSS
jgi:hypothetical protein